MSNNSYTKEFKIKAVELLEQGGKSVRLKFGIRRNLTAEKRTLIC